ncbi:MAG: cytochrome d ubiquinol oxidase subunit II [Bacteroides sp.]|nr:cytochrome d ubiquinol oxidase subunit II [Bacteroides sp.]MCM1414219.1 cytochrome d ubiquinol oxidase subunit II [Bacteroides sp.]MCM1471788.1 cytochrome d ubiquinol oxidase subunit II [Bacteroides sp.]
MATLECLQAYWWLLISVFGGLLVFLLFVQGGQTMLLCRSNSELEQSMMVNVLGRKWELTFTTLVVFGGAFFASFPLFYSTSFGGAYWLWMLILFSFIIQAVSYEFRSKPGNIFGRRFYDTLLFINGCVGCLLLGVAVAMFFFGAEFQVTKTNLLDASAPVISTWVPTHGLEAIVQWRNLVLGVAVLFLARTLGSLYFLKTIAGDAKFLRRQRRSVLVNGVIFVLFFLVFLYLLLTATGVEYTPTGMKEVTNKYLYNLIDLWVAGIIFLVGVVLVLWGVLATAIMPKYVNGIFPAGIGTFLVVTVLFCIAGYNNTAYYPSELDINSSLTIANSSSSLFTLKVMSWVSVIAPLVLAYIAYVWYKMTSKPITPAEIKSTDHKY